MSSFQPTLKILDNWKYWAALEVVSQLKSRVTVLNLDLVKTLIDINKIQVFGDIWSRFENNYNYYKSITSDFNRLNDELQKVYSETISDRLNACADLLSTNFQQSLTRHITQDLDTSPESKMNILKSISKILLRQRREITNNQHVVQKKIYSSSRSYEILLKQNEPSSNIHNAIWVMYKMKFEQDKNKILTKIILVLLKVTQHYYDLARKSFLLLSRVEKSLKKKTDLKIVSIPIFLHFASIDIDYQQSLIDSWLGCGIDHWGVSKLCSVQDFEAKVLSNVEGDIQRLMIRFQTSFFEA